MSFRCPVRGVAVQPRCSRLGAVARSRHWAYLCAKLVARGREHLERAEAGQQGQRLRHMTERDIAAVQAVVDAWSQQHG